MNLLSERQEWWDRVADVHARLGRVLGQDAEPLDMLACAEQHRWFWRPERVRVVLVAESHVDTGVDEIERSVILPPSAPPGVPQGFVRLVYCLGYGENELLDRPIFSPANNGTVQYSQIFYSCANLIRTGADFAPILKTRTTFAERIANKLRLLATLRELGVWLLDASPAALYVPGGAKPDRQTIESCLRIGWDYHVRAIVEAAAPSHIVCIGSGVHRSLASRLARVGANISVVPQPNARLSSHEHLASFQTYYRVVQAAQSM